MNVDDATPAASRNVRSRYLRLWGVILALAAPLVARMFTWHPDGGIFAGKPNPVTEQGGYLLLSYGDAQLPGAAPNCNTTELFVAVSSGAGDTDARVLARST